MKSDHLMIPMVCGVIQGITKVARDSGSANL